MNRNRVIDKLTSLEVAGSQYEIVKEIGRGGNGVALLCKSANNELVVAKVYIPPDNRDLDEKALERFQNEIALTEKLKHPNIVRSLGFGAASVGTYRLPFYLMPQAAGTLRNEIRTDTDPAQIERKLRIFLRAAYGVACLHSHGIVHRDLKPENILMNRSGTPWVADLGIAHVNPEFVSVGLKTIESERLLNRDYYAPEQRFGNATSVDHRADVYALGCIFYELLTSIPPVRTNAPKLSVVSSAYKPFEGVWERMTAWDVTARYQTIEDALEDLSVTVGWVLASVRGAAGLQHPDVPTMIKLLKTSNEAKRQQGVDIATRLGKAALPELHDLLGHTRRDIRNSAALALEQILDSSSIPFLVAGLYGNANRPGHFRPSVDIAAHALAQFSPEQRLQALESVKYPIRPNQILTILDGLHSDEAYACAEQLRQKGLMLTDWGETDLQVFLAINEERAWPEVKALIGKRQEFSLRHTYPHLSNARRIELMLDLATDGLDDAYHYPWLVDAILVLECDSDTRHFLTETLKDNIENYSGRFEQRERLLKKLNFSS